jgi:hypothetical protein
MPDGRPTFAITPLPYDGGVSEPAASRVDGRRMGTALLLLLLVAGGCARVASLDGGAEPLRARFERERARPRLVALASPT